MIRDPSLVAGSHRGCFGIYGANRARAVGLQSRSLLDCHPTVEFGDKKRSARCRVLRVGRADMMFMPAAGQLEDMDRPDDLDAAKALFMTEVARLVEERRGELVRLESGTLELRLVTGEIYHLGARSITRIG